MAVVDDGFTDPLLVPVELDDPEWMSPVLLVITLSVGCGVERVSTVPMLQSTLYGRA